MGACIVNGIGAGPAETIMPEIIADIFFLHDRGKWNTLYWVVYMVSLSIPVHPRLLTILHRALLWSVLLFPVA